MGTAVVGGASDPYSTPVGGAVSDPYSTPAMGTAVAGGASDPYSAPVDEPDQSSAPVQPVVNDPLGPVVGFTLVTGTNWADTLTGDAGDDIIVGKGGADLVTGGTGTNKFLFGDLASAGDTIADYVFPGADNALAFSESGGFSVANTVGTGNIQSALTSMPTELAPENFMIASFSQIAGNNPDLNTFDVFAIRGTDGVYSSSNDAITALNAVGTGTDIGTGGAFFIYAISTDNYQLSYDANGAMPDGETVVASLGGVTDANIDTEITNADFSFYA
jgi:hypothetical protein